MIGMRRKGGVTDALVRLRPGAQFIVRNDSYDEVEWHSQDMTIPTREDVESMVAQIDAEEPMRCLREIRDWYLTRSDWTQGYDIRQLRGPEWCAAWDAYRQALRDLPLNSSPYFSDDSDMIIRGVEWPTQPPA